MGKKNICRECSKAKFPAISAAKLGHEGCLVTAYRVLGVCNERDSYGATPIHYAARNGRLDCLQWLVKHSGISPVAAAKNGTTAAHDSAAMGHVSCLQFLLEETKCSAQDRTNEGATLLHMACRFGHVGVTRWLVEKGLSSPSEKGDNGVTPVHLCGAKNHLDCLKYLTASLRYLPNELTVHGATPVYFAAQEGSLECLEWLIKNGEGDPSIFANDGMGPLHAAAQAGEVRCVMWLVQHGRVSINQKAEDGATPMHFAAAGGQIACLKWLVDNGGSLLDRDDLGGTPLHDAAEQGQTEVVSFILGCGVEKDIADNEGYTPIDLAKDNNHVDCMKLFYIKTPNLLDSFAPQQPQNRASTIDDEALRREKQWRFEAALLSNTTATEREDIWKEAKRNVPDHDVTFSIEQTGVANPDSRRLKRQNSLNTHRQSISSLTDLLEDHLGKERPALSPELFTEPQNVEEDEEELENVNKETYVPNSGDDKDQTHSVLKPRHIDNHLDSREDDKEEEEEMEEEEGEENEGGSFVVTAKNLTFTRDGNEGAIKNGFEDDSVIESPYDNYNPLDKENEMVKPVSVPATKPSRWSSFLKHLGWKKPKNETKNKISKLNKQSDDACSNRVVLRRKPGDAEVFSHRTSKEEEFAIVTHRKLSTDDDEVAVKFETKRIAVRQSALSVDDNMSSPDTSGDEREKVDEEQEEEEDIFKPISKTGFDRFGKLITEREGISSGYGSGYPDKSDNLVQKADREIDNTLLENRGSLASIDTVVIHEDAEESTVGVETPETGPSNAPDVRSEENVTVSQFIHSVSSNIEAKLQMFNEPITKSFPSPKREFRRPPVQMTIKEEDEESNEEGEDSLPPLPRIQRPSYSRSISEERMTIDGRESPEMKRRKMAETAIKKTTMPLSTKSPVSALNSSSSPEKTGVRSFALMKQFYESSGTSPENVGMTRLPGVRRSTPVYSPLMVVATASHKTVSPRTSLSSVQEEAMEEENGQEEDASDQESVSDKEERDKEEEEETENRVSLTPSQEMAFNNLEKLKESLDETPDKQNAGTEGGGPEHTEAMRTSPDVQELSNLIQGLDDLIKAKRSAWTPDDSSDDISVSGYVLQSLSSTPRQPKRNDADVKVKEIMTEVEVDGHRRVQVSISRNAVAISLIFKTAERLGLQLSLTHALFEVHESLKIERPVEDHERIDEILLRWPRKNQPHFHLHTYHEKYLLWEDNPLPRGYIGQFLKQGKVPNVSSVLHYSRGGRLRWNRSSYCLGSLGIYQIEQTRTSNSMDLVCATDQLLYFPLHTGDRAKKQALPSKHCFIMKPAHSWKDKDLKLFCCEDYDTFIQWISGIRLVKYGLQLKGNYIAMGKRVERQLVTGISLPNST